MGRIGQKVKKGAMFGAKVVGGAILGASALAGGAGIGVKSTGDYDIGSGAPELKDNSVLIRQMAEVGRQSSSSANSPFDDDDFDMSGFGSSGFGTGVFKKGGRVRKYKKHCS